MESDSISRNRSKSKKFKREHRSGDKDSNHSPTNSNTKDVTKYKSRESKSSSQFDQMTVDDPAWESTKKFDKQHHVSDNLSSDEGETASKASSHSSNTLSESSRSSSSVRKIDRDVNKPQAYASGHHRHQHRRHHHRRHRRNDEIDQKSSSTHHKSRYRRETRESAPPPDSSRLLNYLKSSKHKRKSVEKDRDSGQDNPKRQNYQKYDTNSKLGSDEAKRDRMMTTRDVQQNNVKFQTDSNNDVTNLTGDGEHDYQNNNREDSSLTNEVTVELEKKVVPESKPLISLTTQEIHKQILSRYDSFSSSSSESNLSIVDRSQIEDLNDNADKELESELKSREMGHDLDDGHNLKSSRVPSKPFYYPSLQVIS